MHQPASPAPAAPPPAAEAPLPARSSASKGKFGFDAYGADAAPTPAPEFTTVVMNAVKQHPLKTVAVVAGVLALGAALSGPVRGAIRR